MDNKLVSHARKMVISCSIIFVIMLFTFLFTFSDKSTNLNDIAVDPPLSFFVHSIAGWLAIMAIIVAIFVIVILFLMRRIDR